MKNIKIFLNYSNDLEIEKSEKAFKILQNDKKFNLKNCDFKKEKRNGQYLIIEKENQKEYIGYSSLKPNGRNTFILQGFEGAYIEYLKDCTIKNKKIKFLFLYNFFEKNSKKSNNFFDYSIILLKSLNVEIINIDFYKWNEKDNDNNRFYDASQIQNFKTKIYKKNNNPTIVFYDKEENKIINYIFCKFDGANSSDSFLLILLLSNFGETKINIKNKNKKIPSKYSCIFKNNPNLFFDNEIKNKLEIKKEKNIRNQSKFVYELFKKYKNKKCLMCDCEIYDLIEAAHIFSISEIKKEKIDNKKKEKQAIDSNNGMWLCILHHKLYDQKKINILNDGKLEISKKLKEKDKNWIFNFTNKKIIFWSEEMNEYYIKNNYYKKKYIINNKN